jgi:hypothetical protein
VAIVFGSRTHRFFIGVGDMSSFCTRHPNSPMRVAIRAAGGDALMLVTQMVPT